jgi:hypothetical protein
MASINQVVLNVTGQCFARRLAPTLEKEKQTAGLDVVAKICASVASS